MCAYYLSTHIFIMINNCAGCEEEWNTMCEAVQNGFHIATSIDRINSYPICRGHYKILVVDDNGNIIIS